MLSQSRRRPCAALTTVALTVLIPSSIAASDRPAPPSEIHISRTQAVALGDWFVDQAGRIVCQTPGSRCLIIYVGAVQFFVPIAAPFGP